MKKKQKVTFGRPKACGSSLFFTSSEVRLGENTVGYLLHERKEETNYFPGSSLEEYCGYDVALYGNSNLRDAKAGTILAVKRMGK